MTSKKRRQRGSTTHGGGTHKNRRGAGNRGGRGRAGRTKHEQQNYEPIGKHGFTRPPDTQETVVEVDLQRLDEEAPLLAEDDAAEQVGDGYRIDAREVADPAAEADLVKVLGNTALRHELTVVADEFSATAEERLEESGGAAIRPDEVAEPSDAE